MTLGSPPVRGRPDIPGFRAARGRGDPSRSALGPSARVNEQSMIHTSGVRQGVCTLPDPCQHAMSHAGLNACALASHARGRRFETRRAHQRNPRFGAARTASTARNDPPARATRRRVRPLPSDQRSLDSAGCVSQEALNPGAPRKGISGVVAGWASHEATNPGAGGITASAQEYRLSPLVWFSAWLGCLAAGWQYPELGGRGPRGAGGVVGGDVQEVGARFEFATGREARE